MARRVGGRSAVHRLASPPSAGPPPGARWGGAGGQRVGGGACGAGGGGRGRGAGGYAGREFSRKRGGPAPAPPLGATRPAAATAARHTEGKQPVIIEGRGRQVR